MNGFGCVFLNNLPQIFGGKRCGQKSFVLCERG